MYNNHKTSAISIFAQVNIKIVQVDSSNLTWSKMAASRFVKVTDKEISEIKINSVPKKHKRLVQKY